MSSITVERVISHPRAEVFAALADFGGIYKFHPVVERSPLNEGSVASGLGAERTCHFYDGNQVKERVVGFEQDEALRVEIYEGSMPLAEAFAQFQFTDVDGGTRVQMSMEYTPKYGIVGKAMDVFMMRGKFNSLLTLLLAALEQHLSTGDVIGPKWVVAAA